MTDCVYFQTIIKELNPADSNSGDCCSWSMVSCEGQNIVKLDFSNYNGINNKVAFPQTIAFLSNLKEFSIQGQQNIIDIYSLPTQSLEKVDLSNSGMSTANFPTWIYDADNLKELDISNTQISGVPQRDIKSKINNCNFSNTPICGAYQSSPYNYMPDSCKSSCSGGYTGPSNSNGGKKNNSGGTKAWPYILIGIGAVIVLGILGYLFMKKGNKGKKEKISLDYEEDSPRPILPVSNKKNKRDESVEIAVNEVPEIQVPTTSFTPNAAAATAAAVSMPPTAAMVAQRPNDKRVEMASNNYNISYNDSNPQQVNYNENPRASMSFEQDGLQTHPSIYNTMTTDIDSDEDNDVENIIKGQIINEEQQQPNLLRRKSSRKNNVTKEKSSAPSEPDSDEEEEEDDELFIANWNYDPAYEDELSLAAGDIIEIKKKFDDGWCKGYNRRTQKSGIVPFCYLKEYEE